MAKRTRSAKPRQKTLPKQPGKTVDAASQNESPQNESPLEDSDPRKDSFNPENLDRTVIAIPLLRDLKKEREGKKKPEIHSIIIDLNLLFPGGRDASVQYVQQKISEVLKELGDARQREEGLR